MSELKNLSRKRRHLRIRKRVMGTPDLPRLSVFRSLRNTYVQLVDDIHGKSLMGCSTLSKRFSEAVKQKKETKKSSAGILGKMIAEMALEKGIKKIVFDKGGYKYHGRIQAIAEGARKAGLKF